MTIQIALPITLTGHTTNTKVHNVVISCIDNYLNTIYVFVLLVGRDLMTCEQNTVKTKTDHSIMRGTVKIVSAKTLTKHISDGKVCGSSINPLKIAKELEDDGLSGVLYYAITDDMTRKVQNLEKLGKFPLNQKYSKTEEGPGFAFVFCSSDTETDD